MDLDKMRQFVRDCWLAGLRQNEVQHMFGNYWVAERGTVPPYRVFLSVLGQQYRNLNSSIMAK